MIKKPKKKQKPYKPKQYCHECQVKRGGIPVEYPVTCSAGKCDLCKTKDSTIVPDCDYNWPTKKGIKAIWD